MKQFVWEPAARADLRRIDRDTARRILLAVTKFGRTGHGDAKRLTDREGLYRLRIGKWRLFSISTRLIPFGFTGSTTAAKPTKLSSQAELQRR